MIVYENVYSECAPAVKYVYVHVQYAYNVHYTCMHSHVVCVSSVVSGDPPSLPELLQLQVQQRVGNNYTNFGIFLLEDRTGSRVDAIGDKCRGNPERITRKILQEWVAGSADLGHTRQDTERLQAYCSSRQSTGLKTASCSIACMDHQTE